MCLYVVCTSYVFLQLIPGLTSIVLLSCEHVCLPPQDVGKYSGGTTIADCVNQTRPAKGDSILGVLQADLLAADLFCLGTDDTQEEQCCERNGTFHVIVLLAFCCLPALIYSLAAVRQLLKHFLNSDVFVSCLE